MREGQDLEGSELKVYGILWKDQTWYQGGGGFIFNTHQIGVAHAQAHSLNERWPGWPPVVVKEIGADGRPLDIQIKEL